MKRLKIFGILNLIVFGSFILFEVYHFLFEYKECFGMLSNFYPCVVSYRIPHYILTLIILYGSIQILFKKKAAFNTLLIASIGFISYEIVVFISLFFSTIFGEHCFMSLIEMLPFIYIFALIEFLSLLKKRKEFSTAFNTPKILITFLLFILFFFAMRIVFYYRYVGLL